MRDRLDAIRGYADRPVLVALAMAFASGLPLVLTGGTLTFWLAQEHVSKATVGLFALVGWPYTWKWLWSPILDRLPLPLLTAQSWTGPVGCAITRISYGSPAR